MDLLAIYARYGVSYAMNHKPISVGMVSLGCPKNLVDSEIMLGLLKTSKYRVASDMNDCDVALINTCAFIEDSRKESIDSILELAELKKRGKIKGLIVCGCLPQKYYKSLKEGISEIDAMVGTGDYSKIDEIVDSVLKGDKVSRVEDTRFIYDHSAPRFSLTPPHFRYVKVGEGCDHRCTFCIIPQLRGDYRSRPLESIETEIRRLVSEGMKEANLISQDTSYYGRDLGGQYLLPALLNKLNAIEGLGWVRLLYNHPFHMTDEILEAMAGLEKICKYIDIPLQHISDRMLKSMKRGILKDKTVPLIERMRAKIPDLTIRTTFIVGYPGETDEDFRELYDFAADAKFERLGVFTYSRGDDEGAKLADQIPEKIKIERRKTIMELQQKISLEHNRKLAGKRMKVLVDREEPSGRFVGRTYRDAPEIDGQVFIRKPVSGKITAGEFYNVEIKSAMEYDLTGEFVMP